MKETIAAENRAKALAAMARLRRVRKAHGMTQAEAAERAGVSVDMMRLIEGGHVAPSIETLVGLSRAYRMSLGALMLSVEI